MDKFLVTFGPTLSVITNTSVLLWLGGILFVGGFLSFFFTHSIVSAAIIAGMGYVFATLGVISWSLASTGDLPL